MIYDILKAKNFCDKATTFCEVGERTPNIKEVKPFYKHFRPFKFADAKIANESEREREIKNELVHP